MNFSSLKPDTENNANLTLYQANAATLTPFSKEDKILIKNLCKCKGYNARQFIIKFPDKSWTKNSINGEVKKVRNSIVMLTCSFDAQFSSLSVMRFRTNII